MEDHGTYSTYLTAGCRCIDCTAANAASKAAWRARVREKFGHGTPKGIDEGCRCRLCKPKKEPIRKKK